MNDEPEQADEKVEAAFLEIAPVVEPSISGPFFERTDWVSFGMATILTLVIYLCTLTPSIGLGNDGIYVTAAAYASGSNPSGYPAFGIYAWFTVLLPLNNMAWRVAVSSAVAAAFSCGLIALMVSRGGRLMLEGLRDFRRLEPKAERWLRVVAGQTAGMGFGLSTIIWSKAVIADPWTFGVLLFALMICLLMRWLYAPEKLGVLYSALFVYGVTLTNSQSFYAIAIAVQFLILCGNSKLGRDIFFASTLVLLVIIVDLIMEDSNRAELCIFVVLVIITTSLSGVLIFKTRKLFTHWKTVWWCGFFVALGLAFYFYLPISSMTTPPMNWGYPRTVEGFYHMLTRGQYDRANPVSDFNRFSDAVEFYWGIIYNDFGWIYVALAMVPFFLITKMQARERKWMCGLAALFMCASFLILIVLNPELYRGFAMETEYFLPPRF